MALQPEQTFRPNRLWRLPFLGLHDYALPQTIDIWLGGMTRVAEDLAKGPIELVVVATDLTDTAPTDTGFELVYSSRVTPPDELAQAILASAAVSALVMPLRVGDRIATDGAWVRNFPRAGRGEPAHLADMIVRLARVTIRRNTLSEERIAQATDQSLRELRSLRHDVLGLVDEPGLHEAVAARFAAANFPFGQDRLVPRIIIHGRTDGPGLEPGVRNQPHWSEEDKRRLIRRGWELADRELRRRLH
jgi:hypothetical protein